MYLGNNIGNYTKGKKNFKNLGNYILPGTNQTNFGILSLSFNKITLFFVKKFRSICEIFTVKNKKRNLVGCVGEYKPTKREIKRIESGRCLVGTIQKKL